MDASELRRMVKYRQAVAIVGNAPPVRFSYPPIAKPGASRLPNRERLWHEVEGSPDALYQDDFNTNEAAISALTGFGAGNPGKAEIVIAMDNRPEFSFGQMLGEKTVAVQPEYDPDSVSPLNDPCFDDAPDRVGFER